MSSLKCTSLVVAVILVISLAEWSSSADFELTILHTNDVHSRIAQTNAYSGQCSASQAEKGECFGGYPRLKSKVDDVRSSYSNVVLVDAGDQFQGTIWFYAYGGNVTQHFMNKLGYDIMALGNHEFDRGPSETELLISKATFPVLSSNTDASAYPGLQSLLKSSYVLEIGGQSVGFVGYTTVDTAVISNPKGVRFMDEVEAVRREVQILTEQGVNLIVCVGHAGYLKDLEIARDIAGVDVVVGGHTNTFLYTGDPPSGEDPVDDYPTVVTRDDGSQALVVQDYAYGKYLGFLQVTFDDQGAVKSYSGNPILLNNSVPRDPAMLSDLEQWRKGVIALSNRTVGKTAVYLDGDRLTCRLKECNLGNLIADAMVMQNVRHSDELEWNHVAIAIVNSGGIRSPLGKGDITVADILSVQPFRSTIDIIVIKGNAFKGIMEHSASQWTPDDPKGGFLQHSGLRVVYDMTKPVGNRVLDIKVKCADCSVPQFEPVEDNKVYKVILNSFLAGGGDGYQVIKDSTLKHHLNGDLDSDVLTEYIQKFSPIIQGLEGRIVFGDQCSTSGADVPGSRTSLMALTSLLGLMVIRLLVAT